MAYFVDSLIVGTSSDRKIYHVVKRIFDVVAGDISVVESKPFVTYEQEKFNEYQSRRLLAKPGLTCYWSAMGRCEMSFDELI